MTLREPGPKTVIPDMVLIKSTGEEIPVKGDPVMVALVAAIGEDFLNPNRHGVIDVVSSAASARLTLRVLEAAGLKAVPIDAACTCTPPSDHYRDWIRDPFCVDHGDPV